MALSENRIFHLIPFLVKTNMGGEENVCFREGMTENRHCSA